MPPVEEVEVGTSRPKGSGVFSALRFWRYLLSGMVGWQGGCRCQLLPVVVLDGATTKGSFVPSEIVFDDERVRGASNACDEEEAF